MPPDPPTAAYFCLLECALHTVVCLVHYHLETETIESDHLNFTSFGPTLLDNADIFISVF